MNLNLREYMMIPFIDLKKSVELIKSEVFSDWESILDKSEFIGGNFVKELEEKLKDKLKVECALACSNGTDAIVIALQAMGIGIGDYVAIPNLTFWATYEAVVQLGAQPILIDIDPENLQMDFNEFKKAFERYRFKASILVHLMGWASDKTDEFREYCISHNILLLEDGAQSYGVLINQESVYSGAMLATLSFYPAKVFGGCMDGGAIVGNNPVLIEKCRSLCNHGRASHYSYDYVGWNSRMGEIQASFLCRTIKYVEDILNERRKYFRLYLELLQNEESLLNCFAPPKGVLGNGYLSVFVIKNRSISAIVESLKIKGIHTGRVYPETIEQQSHAKNAIRISDLKHSKKFCEQVLNLPLFYGITSSQIEKSAHALLEVLRNIS